MVTATPTTHKSVARRIKGLRQQGKFKAAINRGEKYLKEHPTAERVLCSLGYVFLRMGDYKQASKHFEETLRINPRNEVARLLLAYTYLKNKDSQNALATAQATMKNKFHPPTMAFLRVLALRGTGKQYYEQILIACTQQNITPEDLQSLAIEEETETSEEICRSLDAFDQMLGAYARSQIFNTHLIPRPIDTTALNVAGLEWRRQR